jgi:acylphosphatase
MPVRAGQAAEGPADSSGSSKRALPSAVVEGEETIRRHVWVDGRVQGVWFRETCRRLATQLHVVGWVRNRPDGRVEAVFEGSPGAVNQLVRWCRSGPPRADVRDVQVVEEPPVGEGGFSVM